MMQFQRRNIILSIIVVLGLIGMGIVLGRCSKEVKTQQPMLDVTKYDRLIDSVMLSNKQSEFLVNQQQVLIDSLRISLKNKIQYEKETKQIKHFTLSTRSYFRDSVKKAEGL